MLISVIIPAYNAEKYIRQAVDSALNQTYKGEYEVIVVDDASTDNTVDMLSRYGYTDVQLSILTHNTNRGPAYALNTGINKAKGKWIKWLSADDEMLPNCLETLARNATDNNTIYYTNYHIINQLGKKIKDFVETPKDDTQVLWNYFYGNGSSSFIHKDVFERCGLFDESLRFGEDYEFWLRCTMLYNVNLTLISEFTVNYRNHPEQLTHKVGGRNDQIIKEKIKSQIITS